MKKLIITETQAKLLGLIKTPKNTLKITQEQYDRIFGSKIVTEEVKIKGGGVRVDTAFRKESLKELEEPIKTTEFNLSKLKTSGGLPNKPAFGKVMEEVEGQEDFSTEFVKFLYGKGELSEIWTEDKIKEAISKLSSKNLIIPTEDGNFKVPTSLDDPKAAMEAIKQELEAIKPQAEEMGQELIPMDSEQGLEEYGGPDDEPAKINRGTISKKPTIYTVLYVNSGIALLKEKNKMYYFNYRDSKYEDEIEADYVGYWEADIDSGKTELTIEDMQQFINDNIGVLSYGFGKKGIDDGEDLVEIDEYVKNYIASMYGNDKILMSMLSNEMDNQSGLTEMAKSEEWGDVKNKLTKQVTQKPETKNTEETPEAKKARIMASLEKQRTNSAINDKIAADKFNAEKAKYRTDEEIDETMLGGSGGAMQSSGHNNVPLGKLEFENKLNEMTSGPESVGISDKNALPNIGRDGEFKKGKKSKAETTPLYPKGEFPIQPDCSKPNNNKKAQNGGCNSGASSLKTKKASGSIISPSLAENKIYETIAAKTGKSIDEVKRIIKSKNGKA
jgi:hypothetical protein